jgi:hypothetical protein
VEQFVASGAGFPGAALPPQSQEDLLLDTVMLRLRLSEGLDLRQLEADFSANTANRWLLLFVALGALDSLFAVPTWKSPN